MCARCPSTKPAGKGPPPLPNSTGTNSFRWATAGVLVFAATLFRVTLPLVEELHENLSQKHPDCKKESSISCRCVCEASVMHLLEEAVADVIKLIAKLPPIAGLSQRQYFADKAADLVVDVQQNLFRSQARPLHPIIYGSPEGSAPTDKVWLLFKHIPHEVQNVMFAIALSVMHDCQAGTYPPIDESHAIVQKMSEYFARHLMYKIIECLISKLTAFKDEQQKLEQLTADAIIQGNWGSMCLKGTCMAIECLDKDSELVTSMDTLNI